MLPKADFQIFYFELESLLNKLVKPCSFFFFFRKIILNKNAECSTFIKKVNLLFNSPESGHVSHVIKFLRTPVLQNTSGWVLLPINIPLKKAARWLNWRLTWLCYSYICYGTHGQQMHRFPFYSQNFFLKSLFNASGGN